MPLKPFTLDLLTALSSGAAHAYAIEQRMIEDVRSAMPIQSRAVYREIPRLIDSGYIKEVEGTRPQRYQLTAHGRRTLDFERERALQIYRLLQKRL